MSALRAAAISPLVICVAAPFYAAWLYYQTTAALPTLPFPWQEAFVPAALFGGLAGLAFWRLNLQALGASLRPAMPMPLQCQGSMRHSPRARQADAADH